MRTFTPALIAALERGELAVYGMIRFDFGEGSFGFIQRASAKTWNGLTYEPIPNGVLQVSRAGSKSGMSASGATITLAEAPEDELTPDVILQIEDYDYRDAPVTVYDWYVDPETGVQFSDPIPMIGAYCVGIEHIEDPDQGFVAVMELKTRALDYSARNERYRDSEDQARRWPGDRFFDGIPSSGLFSPKWGRK